MEWYYAIVETYISISVYLVLHQIFVISADFVEAFGVPPINIGIYVDKLSSIRALLMTIADIFEWSLTQEALNDPGNTRTLGGSDPGPRRILSVLSFFGLLCSRCCYLWVIYKSRNKAYVVFVTLSVEGFWFGLFQMGFFAIGPEYNAFTSFALHVSGNFVLFFQELIEYFSASHPDWNSLFRVRVHAWIAVVSSTLAWPLWTYFCRDYIQGSGVEFTELIEELAYAAKTATTSDADAIATAVYEGADKFAALVKQLNTTGGINSTGSLNANTLHTALNEGTNNVKKAIVALLQTEFGITDTSQDKITVGTGNTNVEVTINNKSGGGQGPYHEGSSVVNDKVTILVKLDRDLGGATPENASKIAQRVAKAARKAAAAGSDKSYNPGKELVEKEFLPLLKTAFSTQDQVTVEVKKGGGGTDVTVEIKGSGGTSATDPKGSAIVNVKGSPIKIEVKFSNELVTKDNAKADKFGRLISRRIGQAMVDFQVKEAAKEKNKDVTIEFDYGSKVHWYHSMSALCMFPLGAFTEDFMYPGLLPYAFLDPQNANLINYTMPLFYMTGAVFVLLVNDVFHPTGFASGYGDSWFKDWSEGAEPSNGWSYHYMWLLHVPILIVFVLCFMTIHGICPGLRVIVQSRWRVMLLTLTMLIPRSHLEVMGYVGVANYAIAASGTGDFTGFKILDQHHIPRYVINYQD